MLELHCIVSAIDMVEELICIVDGVPIGYEHQVVRNLIVVHEYVVNGLDGIEGVTLRRLITLIGSPCFSMCSLL